MSCELPTAQSAHTHKARRKHQCCECRGIIQPGETYHTFSGCWEGRWSTFKTCPDCQQLRTEADKNADRDDPTPFGYLYEHMRGTHRIDLTLRFCETHIRRCATPWEWAVRQAAVINEERRALKRQNPNVILGGVAAAHLPFSTTD